MVATYYEQDKLQLLANHFEDYLKVRDTTSNSYYAPKDVIPLQVIKDLGLAELVAVPSLFQHTGVHSSLDFNRYYDMHTLPRAYTFPDDRTPITFNSEYLMKDLIEDTSEY